MKQEYQRNGMRLIYYMPKEVDHHAAEQLQKRLDALIDMYQIRELVFDFSETEFMDSSGIGILIGRSRKLHFYNGTVYAAHLEGRAGKIFAASGLGKIIKIWREEENEN